MFDLGRQNYLIPIPPTEAKTRPYTQLEGQTAKPFCEEDRRNPVKKEKKKQSTKHGKWTLRQRMRYLLFLEQNMQLFVDSQIRKRSKIFSKMSKYIKSRKTSQCKSHHQKALKIHKNEPNIAAVLRSNLAPLKAEWREFMRTEERILLDSYPQINNCQNFYKIYKYNDAIRIEINTQYMESYQ